MSLRDDILAKYAPKPQRVEALDGDAVYARALSGADLFDLNAAGSVAEQYVLTVLRGACDAAGAPMFAEEDREIVRSLPAAFCGPVSDLVLKLSGLSGDDAGKGGPPPAGGSPSA